MNKVQLATQLAIRTGLSLSEATAYVNTTLEIIAQALVQDEKVQLVGFGTFENRHRESRIAYHPTTREPVEVPEARIPQFKPSSQLKELVNQ